MWCSSSFWRTENNSILFILFSWTTVARFSMRSQNIGAKSHRCIVIDAIWVSWQWMAKFYACGDQNGIEHHISNVLIPADLSIYRYRLSWILSIRNGWMLFARNEPVEDSTIDVNRTVRCWRHCVQRTHLHLRFVIVTQWVRDAQN